MPTNFLYELEHLINQFSKENDSDTPDFLLAKYLDNCLNNYSDTVKARDKWFGVDMWSDNKKAVTAKKNFSESIQAEMEKLNSNIDMSIKDRKV